MENTKVTPKDLFLHLLAIIALYISTSSLTALFFQYINLAFPDRLDFYYFDSVANIIRYAMASLIIVFPVYLYLSRLLYQEYSLHQEKRELWIRRWLLHFTLFVAAIILITDLVTLVYNFLGGELTARFTLKVSVILIVIGPVFWYYFGDLKNRFSLSNLRILAWLVSILIFISIAAGFFTTGSPFTARLRRFDYQRLNNLQALQSEIVNHWLQKERLPSELSELKDDIRGFTIPRDPETDLNYQYMVTGTLAFKLCADFRLESLKDDIDQPRGFYSGGNWSHSAGEFCFNRKIDPEIYKPESKPMPVKR